MTRASQAPVPLPRGSDVPAAFAQSASGAALENTAVKALRTDRVFPTFSPRMQLAGHSLLMSLEDQEIWILREAVILCGFAVCVLRSIYLHPSGEDILGSLLEALQFQFYLVFKRCPTGTPVWV